jgi:hypothetical protein
MNQLRLSRQQVRMMIQERQNQTKLENYVAKIHTPTPIAAAFRQAFGVIRK